VASLAAIIRQAPPQSVCRWLRLTLLLSCHSRPSAIWRVCMVEQLAHASSFVRVSPLCLSLVCRQGDEERKISCYQFDNHKLIILHGATVPSHGTGGMDLLHHLLHCFLLLVMARPRSPLPLSAPSVVGECRSCLVSIGRLAFNNWLPPSLGAARCTLVSPEPGDGVPLPDQDQRVLLFRVSP
jgi:hypothetical protein